MNDFGIANAARVFANLSSPALYEEEVSRKEARVAHLGPLVVRTGHHTGRSPNDKFIVREPSSEGRIGWGEVNRPFDAGAFDLLHQRQLAYLQDKDIFVQDCYIGADPQHQVPIRVITETAWHSLFARTMFVRAPATLDTFQPQFTIIHTPRFHAVQEVDQTTGEAFIILHFGQRLVLIGGTSYAGEIKKSAFTVMNYLQPQAHVLCMHCSANYGTDKDDVALFFGLSGTGKTTLSTSPDRTLIGDDEHGWSGRGIFNFEGGCYAKCVGVTAESEPEIYETTRRFGTILENVAIDPLTRRISLSDTNLTENTRAAYPITHIPTADRDGWGGHPRNIVFLAYDAFGVLPPVSRLTPEQARYHFLSGYTSKVAGTEAGVKEPKTVFSACFGAPFMPLRPKVYADLLAEKIARHNVTCWLVNTGITGGPYGVGRRVDLKHTRAIVRAILDHRLSKIAVRPGLFNTSIPVECPNVPAELLDPRTSWSDPDQYDRAAQELVGRFAENSRCHDD